MYFDEFRSDNEDTAFRLTHDFRNKLVRGDIWVREEPGKVLHQWIIWEIVDEKTKERKEVSRGEAWLDRQTVPLTTEEAIGS